LFISATSNGWRVVDFRFRRSRCNSLHGGRRTFAAQFVHNRVALSGSNDKLEKLERGPALIELVVQPQFGRYAYVRDEFALAVWTREPVFVPQSFRRDQLAEIDPREAVWAGKPWPRYLPDDPFAKALFFVHGYP
jgi:hypothetical protein